MFNAKYIIESMTNLISRFSLFFFSFCFCNKIYLKKKLLNKFLMWMNLRDLHFFNITCFMAETQNKPKSRCWDLSRDVFIHMYDRWTRKLPPNYIATNFWCHHYGTLTDKKNCTGLLSVQPIRRRIINYLNTTHPLCVNSFEYNAPTVCKQFWAKN